MLGKVTIDDHVNVLERYLQNFNGSLFKIRVIKGLISHSVTNRGNKYNLTSLFLKTDLWHWGPTFKCPHRSIVH